MFSTGVDRRTRDPNNEPIQLPLQRPRQQRPIIRTKIILIPAPFLLVDHLRLRRHLRAVIYDIAPHSSTRSNVFLRRVHDLPVLSVCHFRFQTVHLYRWVISSLISSWSFWLIYGFTSDTLPPPFRLHLPRDTCRSFLLIFEGITRRCLLLPSVVYLYSYRFIRLIFGGR